ncbi:MAG: 6-phosphofructokinase [Bdellovibrio sp.]|nr:MAG: 6-phosphofructokinase [Bdellovibrio sp.]
MAGQFNSSQLKKIGVFTSGGDAPGMNAAIRAIVRTACYYNLEVVGFIHGYQGIINKDFVPLAPRSVANIIQRGGTILKAGRCQKFLDPQIRKAAAHNLKELKVDALLCIGGDGSFKGAHIFWEEHHIPIVGLPGTIDNDIYGTDNTIGFNTAVNTALEAIDRIRDTAASHDRLFIVEVMGRDSGFIASAVGLAGGAENIFIPEEPYSIKSIIKSIKESIRKGKKSSILVTAEGQKPGRAYDLAEALRKQGGFEAKVCILGHIQRGGSPSATDRILASQFGFMGVEELRRGHCDIFVGIKNNQFVSTPLQEAINKKKDIDKKFLKLIHILSS